ncbi:MAG: 3-phosphoshikimate 1-carboxyvinyltransferase, partial [Deltaproteobacteria bacterium]|nr:3-phosphoshikimate 1-carboxyvinyltransferase [Deltaproteobacteria bacterium]
MEIKPLERLDATVRIPGSKSYTQRAMVIAALAEGESLLRNALLSDDTRILATALGNLGAHIRTEGARTVVRGNGGRIAFPSREIHLGNNGTAMRLLAGVASLGEGPVVLTGDPRMRERPMKPLLEALRALGVDVRTANDGGYPPVTIRGGRLSGGEVVFKEIESSQYVSAILIAAPFADKATTILLEGRVPSLPYIALTVETMNAFGAEVAVDLPGRFVVKGGQRYRGREYRIEGDVSSASYFFLAAVLTKGR